MDNLVLDPIIKDYRNLLESEEDFSLKHVYREGNKCVGKLLNMAIEFPTGEHVLSSPLTV